MADSSAMLMTVIVELGRIAQRLANIEKLLEAAVKSPVMQNEGEAQASPIVKAQTQKVKRDANQKPS